MLEYHVSFIIVVHIVCHGECIKSQVCSLCVLRCHLESSSVAEVLVCLMWWFEVDLGVQFRGFTKVSSLAVLRIVSTFS